MGDVESNRPGPPERGVVPEKPAETRAHIQHLRSIEDLALQLGCDVDVIAPIYAIVLAHLQADAMVTDYLPVLVAKRIKAMWRQ